MKRRYIFICILLILTLLIGCTPETTKPEKEKLEKTEAKKEEPAISKTIPEDFPIDLVPLYEVDKIEGVISVEKEYYQVYYFSNKDKKEIFDHYKEVFKDKDIQPYENEYSYELRGDIDDFKLKMHILPSNEEGYTTNIIIFLNKEQESS